VRFNWALTEDRFDQLTERLPNRLDVSARGDRHDRRGCRSRSTSFGRREAARAGGAAVRRRCRRQPEPKFSVAERMATVWSADRAVQSAGRAKVGLRTPAALYATAYGDAAVTKIHRPYETLLGLSRRLDIPIQWAALLGPERAFADAVLSSGAEVGWSAMNTSGSRRSLRVFPPSTAPPSPACGRMTASTSSGRLL
jgi:hypothetical protein